eukprot:4747610-Pyramimonas_sp.AAC.1
MPASASARETSPSTRLTPLIPTPSRPSGGARGTRPPRPASAGTPCLTTTPSEGQTTTTTQPAGRPLDGISWLDAN